MLFRSSARASAATIRQLSAARSVRNASSLVFIEHRGGKMDDSVLHAVSAARQVKGDVGAFVIGSDADVAKVVDEVKK